MREWSHLAMVLSMKQLWRCPQGYFKGIEKYTWMYLCTPTHVNINVFIVWYILLASVSTKRPETESHSYYF